MTGILMILPPGTGMGWAWLLLHVILCFWTGVIIVFVCVCVWSCCQYRYVYGFVCIYVYIGRTMPCQHAPSSSYLKQRSIPISGHYESIIWCRSQAAGRSRRCHQRRRPGDDDYNINLLAHRAVSTQSLPLLVTPVSSRVFPYCHFRHTRPQHD